MQERTKRMVNAGIIGASVMLVIAGVAQYIFYQNYQENESDMRAEYKKELQELSEITVQNQRALSLVRDVEPNELIHESMLQEVYLPNAASPEDHFILVGGSETEYFAKTGIKANTPLTESMLYQNENITKDIREAEYSFVTLPSNIKSEDVVDIRIQFPSGDDFVLLSKKKIKNVLGVTLWINIEEGEILTMSSAIVDAYIQGAKIYAMPYVDKNMQDASEMTYPVKENVKELIQESPNIVNIAKLNLEQQNRERLDSNMSALDIQDASKVQSGENHTNTRAITERDRLSAEEKLNQINEEIKQEDILGSGGE